MFNKWKTKKKKKRANISVIFVSWNYILINFVYIDFDWLENCWKNDLNTKQKQH